MTDLPKLLALCGCLLWPLSAAQVAESKNGAGGHLTGNGVPPTPCVLGTTYVRLDVQEVYICFSTGAWTLAYPGAGGSVPAGSILLTTEVGGCPVGFTEAADLDGVGLVGTLVAHADVGTTGGSDTLTPVGTVSAPTFMGSPLTTSSDSAGTPSGTVSQPIFTGSSANTSGDSAGTPTGTNSAPTFTGAALGTHLHGVGTLGASAPTFTGSSGTVPAQTISWPAGVPDFSGTPFSSIINHTHTVSVTDPGHTHIETAPTSQNGGQDSFTRDASTTGVSNTAISTASNTTGITASTQNPAGGVASITPAGTIAWPAGVPTNGTVNFTPTGTNSAPGLSGSTEAVSGGTPAGTVSAPVFTGDAMGTHQHSVTATGTVTQPTFAGAALAGHSHTGTPAGTVSAPTFSGASADNRSAFTRVIFCRKD